MKATSVMEVCYQRCILLVWSKGKIVERPHVGLKRGFHEGSHLFQFQTQRFRHANGTSPTQTGDGVNLILIGKLQYFSNLKVRTWG